MDPQFSVLTSSVIKVTITSSVTSFASEKRLQKSHNVAKLKSELELVTGASAARMQIQVFDKKGNLVCEMADDSALVGSYPIDDEMRLHVIDPERRAGEFEDVSRVAKYEMSQDEYEKRSESLRAFKRANKLGEFDEKKRAELERSRAERDVERSQLITRMQVGNRCEVRSGARRRGEVRFIGPAHFNKAGTGNFWVGVALDEPLGKHDGSVDGRRYFECQPGYGIFLRPEFVVVGDFPELSIDELLAEADADMDGGAAPGRSMSQAESLCSSNDPDEI